MNHDDSRVNSSELPPWLATVSSPPPGTGCVVHARMGGCAGAAAPEDGFPFPAPKAAALVQAEAAAPRTRAVLGPGPRAEGERARDCACT